MKNKIIIIIGTTSVAIVLCLLTLQKISNRYKYFEDFYKRFPRQCRNCNYPIMNENLGTEEFPDPSLEPVFYYTGNLGKQHRFIADFNNDGLNDMAISEEENYFGTGGGSWGLFLQTTNGMYRGAGSFGSYANLNSIRIEFLRDHDNVAHLWSYSSSGGGQYLISCQQINNKGNLSWGSNILCFMWDGIEGDSLSNRIFNEIFGEPHEVPIRFEYSNSTNALGQAVWVLEDEYIPPKRENENPSNEEGKD